MRTSLLFYWLLGVRARRKRRKQSLSPMPKLFQHNNKKYYYMKNLPLQKLFFRYKVLIMSTNNLSCKDRIFTWWTFFLYIVHCTPWAIKNNMNHLLLLVYYSREPQHNINYFFCCIFYSLIKLNGVFHVLCHSFESLYILEIRHKILTIKRWFPQAIFKGN